MKLSIRKFRKNDIQNIANALIEIGWRDRTTTLKEYLSEQTEKERIVMVASLDNKSAGYITILWRSVYPPFAEKSIPEIKDLNVLPIFRRQGIASKLLDRAEELISQCSDIAGIAAGMFSDYGAAQRLYIKRGYIPDGLGLFYHGKHIKMGQKITIDDDLDLYLTKTLPTKIRNF
jgi:ribosomal protein S18 acetylase RimI-like enzyme